MELISVQALTKAKKYGIRKDKIFR
jgi:hypothetical protein